jgi:hypothetical protein
LDKSIKERTKMLFIRKAPDAGSETFTEAFWQATNCKLRYAKRISPHVRLPGTKLKLDISDL